MGHPPWRPPPGNVRSGIPHHCEFGGHVPVSGPNLRRRGPHPSTAGCQCRYPPGRFSSSNVCGSLCDLNNFRPHSVVEYPHFSEPTTICGAILSVTLMDPPSRGEMPSPHPCGARWRCPTFAPAVVGFTSLVEGRRSRPGWRLIRC